MFKVILFVSVLVSILFSQPMNEDIINNEGIIKSETNDGTKKTSMLMDFDGGFINDSGYRIIFTYIEDDFINLVGRSSLLVNICYNKC